MSVQLRSKIKESESHVQSADYDLLRNCDLTKFSLSAIVGCGSAIREFQQSSNSLEQVANKLVDHLFQSFRNPRTNEADIALARFFKTHAFGQLDEPLRAAAQELCPTHQLKDDTKCLVLLATRGLATEWNSRQDSEGHKAIPLVSKASVSAIPMIAQLIKQFGLQIEEVVSTPEELLVELDERNYNVFHVEQAVGSPFIPAQEPFVVPYGVQSVLGFGGMLPTGNLFAGIMFARVPIPRSTAESFRTIALSVKTSILPFESGRVFDQPGGNQDAAPAMEIKPSPAEQLGLYRSQSAALEELGAVYNRMVIEQSAHLEKTVHELEQRTEALENAHAKLLQSEKLAAVGSLAAGIAHEINTPTQFVGDNLHACKKMFDDLVSVYRAYKDAFSKLADSDGVAQETFDELQRLESDTDVEYILDDAPQAFAQTGEGIHRIRSIVQAMKNFAHSGSSDEQSHFDINESIQNTLVVARNEYKHIAEIELDLGELPQYLGFVSEFNQVILNLIVNAAHAIGDKGSGVGTIGIRTRQKPGEIQITVEDSGCGIPSDIHHRVFEPFFSTKEVGRGSGQGLAIAYQIVTERHDGMLEFETELDVGTTFRITLPTVERGNAEGIA